MRTLAPMAAVLAACVSPARSTHDGAAAEDSASDRDTDGGDIDGGDTNGGDTNGGDTNGGDTNGGDGAVPPPIALTLSLRDGWYGAAIEGATVTALDEGAAGATDRSGSVTIDVRADAAFTVTLAASGFPGATLVGTTRDAALSLGLPWHSEGAIDDAAARAGIAHDPSLAVVVVPILDALDALGPLTWVPGLTLTLDVGSDAALVADRDGTLVGGGSTLEGAPAELVFLNVPPGDVSLAWRTYPSGCATQRMLTTPLDAPFPAEPGRVTIVPVVADCD